MKISSLQLDAFYQTAKLRSFSKAATVLAVTQSALSQRIANLEKDLEVTLFIRDPSGPILTNAGEVLLRYCQTTSSLESEVFSQLKSEQGELRGIIRVAGFSSVLRSVIIPSLTDFLRKNKNVQIEFRSYEMSELPEVLKNAEADLVVIDYALKKKGIVATPIGLEEYVVIEGYRYSRSDNVFLDNAPEDHATELFFQYQGGLPKNFKRTFMGDVYGIIDGVENGLGKAIMSKHLIKDNSKIKILKGYKKYDREVTLHYFEQPYYSKLHQVLVAEITEKSRNFLS